MRNRSAYDIGLRLGLVQTIGRLSDITIGTGYNKAWWTSMDNVVTNSHFESFGFFTNVNSGEAYHSPLGAPLAPTATTPGQLPTPYHA